MRRLRLLLFVTAACVWPVCGFAAPAEQSFPAAGSATTPGTTAAPAVPDATPAMPYSYQVDGRRDPFQSLTATTTDDKAPRPTAAGIAGIRIDELSVRGVMRSRERLVAMVTGPDNRTYVVHPGDKLADGVVKSINPQGVVLVQDVNDPLAREKTREVRKLLRAEDEKE